MIKPQLRVSSICFNLIFVASVALLGSASACPAAEDDLLVLEEQAMKAAVERVAPSVVRIETLGGLETVDELLIGTGPTTGLVVSADGYIVSSAFNFVQKPASILVALPGGERVPAKLVSRDDTRMLVLLKIEAKQPLAVPAPAAPESMLVGQWTIAVGRTFEAGQANLSVGVLSAVGRIWGKAVQTDAKISPSNYGGPLVNIRGEVLGVLVPLSPQETGEVAGVEWYDSGIGFAVPLTHINRMLPQWKKGDLHAGLLGMSVSSTDLYASPARIAACRPKSPAYEAGLRAGDEILEIDGRPIAHHADVRQAIVGRYAGETLRIVVKRKEEKLDRQIKLAATLPPYEQPFLGILPMRDAESCVVRYVYENSPAAKAGIEPGDELVSVAGEKAESSEDVVKALAAFAPEGTASVELRRGGETKKVEVRLGVLPELVPGQLPPARKPVAVPRIAPRVGSFHVKVPELPGDAVAYVPEGYHPDVPHGVLVWLHGPGGFQEEQLLAKWRDACRQRDLILLAPKSSDPGKWQRTEREFVLKALHEIVRLYKVDPQRIVVAGQQSGGAMAWSLAMAQRDVIRGVAVIDAPLPAGIAVPGTDPVHRLAAYVFALTGSGSTPQLQSDVKRLRGLKYPVTVTELGGGSTQLPAEELEKLARWVDTLDRI